MLLYYGVLIKISNLHAAAGGQSIGKYLTKHAAAEQQSKYPAKKHILTKSFIKEDISSKKT